MPEEPKTIDELPEKALKAIEFAVESRMDLESDESCTIIASQKLINNIKIAIAKGQIFKDLYSRIILKPNPSIAAGSTEMIIIPDSMIEAAMENQIKAFLAENAEVQEKMKVLNEMMKDIDEETLTRISTTPEKDLSLEDLKLKTEIQSRMIEVGMNVDLQFSNNENQEAAVIDDVFNSIARQTSAINIEGVK